VGEQMAVRTGLLVFTGDGCPDCAKWWRNRPRPGV